MRQIKVQSLSAEGFRKYGEFIDLLDDKALSAASVFPHSFFADVLSLDFGKELQPTVSVCQLKRPQDLVVRFIEYHRRTCEGILPLDSDVILFVGAPEMGQLSTRYIEAFLVPKGTFVRMNPLIIHGNQIPLQQTGHSLCLLAGRTFANDMEVKVLSDEEKFELALE